jgi:hypothetical protein
MPWPTFKKVFDVLSVKWQTRDGTVESPRYLAWRAVRALDSLGHVDAMFGSGEPSVVVAQPILCRLPVSGLPQAVLCGARSPGTRAAVEHASRGLPCTLSFLPHPCAGHLFLPSRIAVEGETVESLAEFANRLQASLTPTPTAWALAEYSGTVDDYSNASPECATTELNWPRLDFNLETLQFSASARDGPCRLSKYEHPTRSTTVYQLWRAGTYKVVDRDWGRYLALRAHARHVLAYDARHFLLGVPTNVPLPRLLARACALCSGYASRSVRAGGTELPVRCSYEVFTDVPPDIAGTVADKVGQRLVPARLEGVLEE